MKKLILLLLFIPLVSFGQTVVGDFKIIDGEIIWQKIYNDSLSIKSQDLTLKAVGLPIMTTTIFLQEIGGGKLTVNHKNGRTRLTITDIHSISSSSIHLGAVSTNAQKPTYLHRIYARKGKFSKKFLKKDGKLLNEIIKKEINSLISNDDW